MANFLTVICVSCFIGLVAAIVAPETEASAADLPVQVTVDEAEFDAIFVPPGQTGPFILAGDAAGERAF